MTGHSYPPVPAERATQFYAAPPSLLTNLASRYRPAQRPLVRSFPPALISGGPTGDGKDRCYTLDSVSQLS
ncbi:hypothetical protein FTUN_8309 [Frigoriglobus tundricola]|uniref:Uncharacterized protein n=1 Tax=Frigoriglobus tundricola TaxID=2774151 RepID=A0A6M5Z4F6_9BACT|nr:hypothetical protein FTUN_8309 [Frigoriglobus tundricola]